MSLYIFSILILGVIAGALLPFEFNTNNISDYLLLVLLFSVGIDLGLNKGVFLELKKIGIKVLLIPMGIILGSLIGAGFCSLFFKESVREGLALGSGLGWYSLSGILISDLGFIELGAMAFLSNVFREVLAFLLISLIAKKINFITAISPAGATSMDTTLGLIKKNTDEKTAILALISGLVCTLSVPVLVGIFI